MYTLEYLPVAKEDMTEIARYISRELGNPLAADRLATKLMEKIDKLIDFPYACPAYYPIRHLTHDYRKLFVENHLILYWVDEAAKSVTVARVVYAGRDYGKLL